MPQLIINATASEANKLQTVMQTLYDQYVAALQQAGQTPDTFLEWYRKRLIGMAVLDYKTEKRKQLLAAAGSPDEITLT
jgi:hypothetical protein